MAIDTVARVRLLSIQTIGWLMVRLAYWTARRCGSVNKPPVAVRTDGGPSSEPAQDISIKGLVKSFAGNQVLKGIDLDFRPGQITGLMGANGAGKSTLIKILDGIYFSDSGTIKVGGTRVRSLADRPDVGFIHQDLGLIDQLSVSDNLRLGGPPARRAGVLLDREAEQRSAAAAIKRVGLTCPVDALVGSLSPGEKTLVAAARVLDRGVTTLFVDEATSTLPPPDAKRVIGALSAAARAGACIVMVTHKLAEILDSTDRVIVLVDGEVAEDAKTQNLDREALVKMLLAHDIAARESENPVQRRCRAVAPFHGCDN